MERCIKPMFPDPLDALRLLQLADSALPIGGAAHSFGLETLAGEGRIGVEELERFLGDALEEAGALEGSFCRAAHALAGDAWNAAVWVDLNRRLSALRLARERRASEGTGKAGKWVGRTLPVSCRSPGVARCAIPGLRAGSSYAGRDAPGQGRATE